jgi:hypothetical protein
MTSDVLDSAAVDAGAPDSVLGARKARLQELKREVVAEIHGYPPPIPRCDAQFNHLLERRDLILAELSRLAEFERSIAGRPVTERQHAIRDFLASSPAIDNASG